MRLFVGTTQMRTSFSNYRRRFNLLELRSDAPNAPRPGQLAVWAREAGSNFVFSVLLPASVGALNGELAATKQLERALAAADATAAQWLVLRTAPSVGPSVRSQDRIAALVAELVRVGRNIAWDPRGPWQDDLCESFAQKLGLFWVRDLRRDEPPSNPIVYTRLPAQGQPMRGGAIARVAERLAGLEEALVVVEGERAAWASSQLRLSVAEAETAGLGLIEPTSEDADADMDLDDDDEGEDGEQDTDGETEHSP